MEETSPHRAAEPPPCMNNDICREIREDDARNANLTTQQVHPGLALTLDLLSTPRDEARRSIRFTLHCMYSFASTI